MHVQEPLTEQNNIKFKLYILSSLEAILGQFSPCW